MKNVHWLFSFRRLRLVSILVVLALGAAIDLSAQQQAQSSNMALVGSNDLQGRAAYQPTIHKQGDRWIAYIGHHGGSALNPLTGQMENNGTSIVDVTDPANPRYLVHLPGEQGTPGKVEAGGAQMTRVCDGSTLPRADKTKFTCCDPSATLPMRFGTSPVRKNRPASRSSSADSAILTRVGGNVTAELLILWQEIRNGAQSA
jgi:hypothetical protein